MTLACEYPPQWTRVTESVDVEEKWKKYHNTIKEAYRSFFQQINVQIHQADEPWITSRIKSLMQERAIALSLVIVTGAS